MASPTAPPTTPKTTTVDPLLQQAQEIAQSNYDQAAAPIIAQQQASDASYAGQAQQAGVEAQAVANLLKGLGPQVQGAYTQGSQNQALLGAGFSAGLKDALNNNGDEINALLGKLGAPSGQKIGPQGAADAADVLNGIGGYIPATTLNATGTAYGAAFDQLPGFALLKGQDNAQAARNAGNAADATFQSKLADLAAQIPGDVETNYYKLQNLALQNRKFAEQVANDKFNQAYKTASLKLNAGYKSAQLKLAAGKEADLQAYRGQQLKLSAARLAQSQFNSDRSYQLSLARLGVQQQRLQLQAVTAAFKQAHGGYSQQQVTKYQELANSMANAAFHGTSSSQKTITGTSATGKPNSKRTSITVKQTGRQPYFQALGGMLKRGVPVQIALAALDRVYPQNLQPTPAALQQNLGPLAPANIEAAVQKAVINAGPGQVPGFPFNAVGQLEAGSPAVRQVKTFAFNMAAKQYGWGDAGNLQALDYLWTRESGWNPNARNPSSGAAGIPQELGHKVPASYFKDFRVQVAWGLNYIKGRYGSPLAAAQHERQFGWY